MPKAEDWEVEARLNEVKAALHDQVQLARAWGLPAGARLPGVPGHTKRKRRNAALHAVVQSGNARSDIHVAEQQDLQGHTTQEGDTGT
eukprot:5187255-Prorocentrum_lima.AAC.1